MLHLTYIQRVLHHSAYGALIKSEVVRPVKKFMCVSDVYSSHELYTAYCNEYSSPITLYGRLQHNHRAYG